MDEINYLDIAVISLSVLLGIKGILNGLVKELFGLVGIIGGAYIASRLSPEVGAWVDANLYQLENNAAIGLVGFVLTLAVVWLGAVVVGNMISKVLKMTGLGLLDRILGFIFGSGKVFLILSIIIFALSNVEFIRKKAEPYTKNSIVYPWAMYAGESIIKLDPEQISNQITEKIDQAQNQLFETNQSK